MSMMIKVIPVWKCCWKSTSDWDIPCFSKTYLGNWWWVKQITIFRLIIPETKLLLTEVAHFYLYPHQSQHLTVKNSNLPHSVMINNSASLRTYTCGFIVRLRMWDILLTHQLCLKANNSKKGDSWDFSQYFLWFDISTIFKMVHLSHMTQNVSSFVSFLGN